MITPVTYEVAPLLQALPERSELASLLDRTATNEMGGFVLANCTDEDYAAVVDAGYLTGLELDFLDAVPFNYDKDLRDLPDRKTMSAPAALSWESIGITSLHVDGARDERLLSLSRSKSGEYNVRVFPYGDRPEDFRAYRRETSRIIYDGSVDSTYLGSHAASLVVPSGALAVFNAARPHMAMTLESPRSSEVQVLRPARTR
jgi:hypothetical protein